MALRIFFRSKPGKASCLFVYTGETRNRGIFSLNIFHKLMERFDFDPHLLTIVEKAVRAIAYLKT
jgi:hypothetical protein